LELAASDSSQLNQVQKMDAYERYWATGPKMRRQALESPETVCQASKFMSELRHRA
jgi:hypothetical protein